MSENLESAVAVQENVQQQSQESQESQEGQQGQQVNDNQQYVDKFQVLADKEREMYAQKKVFSDQKKEFKKEQELLNGLKDDPEKALEYLGHSYESLVDKIMGNKEAAEKHLTMDDIEKEKEKIKADIFKEIEEKQKKSVQEENAASAEASFKKDIKTMCVDDEKYKLINAFDDYDLIYTAIEQDYNEKSKLYGHEEAAKQIMTKEDAAGRVEKMLASEMEKLFNINIVQEQFKSFLRTSANPVKQENQSHNTLTNEGFNSSTSNIVSDETPEQRLERCSNLIQYNQ